VVEEEEEAGKDFHVHVGTLPEKEYHVHVGTLLSR
jgi:hypothetical protein